MLWMGVAGRGRRTLRLSKTDAGHAGEEGTPWMMFADLTEVARSSCSRLMSWRGRAFVG
jgi:hypothetical protein